MKAVSLLLLAAAAAGGLLLVGHAHAASSTAPKVPAGARVDQLSMPLAGSGMTTLRQSSWNVPADASGQQAGTFTLTQNAADLNDWVLTFKNAATGGAGIIDYAKTPKAGLLAQAAAAGF